MSAAAFAQTLSAPWSVPVNTRADEPTNAPALLAEGQLILAARRQDPAAFEALVRRHQGPLYNFCLRMLGQSADAADVAQESFVQLYSHLDRFDEHEPIAPWLFRVARNRCIDVIRRRRTVPLGMPDDLGEISPLEPADHDPLPEELVERADLQRVLSNAIAHLPPAYAEVVALRYAGDRSFAEIAIILDCEEGAARVRFHRAKALLRRHLRAGPDFPEVQHVGEAPRA
ncbi:MAG: sigma-70 family RNA polymerase sigma factor [Chloroflexi bacterium]|nr:sigma-70 family RNA polymerase sigma factor [Chloroflexota bacterium]